MINELLGDKHFLSVDNYPKTNCILDITHARLGTKEMLI